MRPTRSTRGAILVIAAVLVLATAFLALGARSPASVRPLSFAQQLTAPHHSETDAVSVVDPGDAVVTALPAGQRSSELRLGPLWVLAGLTAALAAICVLRRLRGTPVRSARRVLLRGSVARRAPPLESFA